MKSTCRVFLILLGTCLCRQGQAQNLWSSSSPNIYFNTGNVGIGNSSPQALLDLGPAGGVKSLFYGSGGTLGYYWGTGVNLGQSSNEASIFIGGAAGSCCGSENFAVVSANQSSWPYTSYTSRFVVNSQTGYVGIGTVTPVFKLDITTQEGEASPRLRIANTMATGATAAGSSPTVELLGARGDGNTTFEGRLALGMRRADGNPLTNQTLGAVLFGGQYGTANTFQAGNILYPASIQGIAEGSFGSASSMPVGIAFLTGTSGYDVGAYNVPYGTERMRITNGGNVLIGKSSPTNPSYLLDVAGNVRANTIVVNTTGADYVFDSAYRLYSLPQVEQYIHVHHHLPDISSANQMRDSGLNVGDAQTRLLAKVEELTLYLIDQGKTLKDLEKKGRRVAKLEQEVKALQKENSELRRKMERYAVTGP